MPCQCEQCTTSPAPTWTRAHQTACFARYIDTCAERIARIRSLPSRREALEALPTKIRSLVKPKLETLFYANKQKAP